MAVSVGELEALLILRESVVPALDRIKKALASTDQSVKKTQGAFDSLGKSFTTGLGIGAGLAIAEGAAKALGSAIRGIPAAVVDAVQHLAKFGSEMSDLSARTGVSVEALQELRFAGSLVGVGLSEVTGAVNIMQRQLEKGSSAFGKLGLSVTQLKNERPEEAFAAISREIQKLPTASMQAKAAMDIFGRGGAALLPLLKGGFEDAANEAQHLGIVLDADTVAAADRLDDATTKLHATWEGMQNQFAAVIVQNPEVIGGLEDIAAAIGAISRAARDNKEDLAAYVGMMARLAGLGQAIDAMKIAGALSGGGLPGVRTPLASGAPADIDFDAITARAIKASEGQVKAHDKAAEAAKHAAERAAAAYAKGAEDARTAWDKFLDGAREGTEKLAADMPNLMAAASHAVPTDDFVNALKSAFSLPELSKVIDPATGLWTRYADVVEQELENANAAAEEHAKTIEEEWDEAAIKLDSIAFALDNIDGLFAELGVSADNVLRKMTQGFADVASAAGGFAKAMASGNIFDQIGAGIGLLTTTIGAVANIFRDAEEEVNDLRDSFFKTQGGFEAFSQRLATVTDQDLVRKIFDARTVDQFNAAVSEAMDLLDLQGQAQEKLNDAVERYGFETSELGPLMRQQELDKIAGGLLQDWRLLNAAGVDHQAILNRMGPAFSEYVQTAIASGIPLAESLRGPVEELLAQGKLLDANGVAYESAAAAGITFAETQTEAFTRMADQVERLVGAIERMFGIGPVPDPFAGWTSPGIPGGYQGPPIPQLAKGGDTDDWTPRGLQRGGGFPAILHPNETVLPDADIGSFVNAHLGSSSAAQEMASETRALRKEVAALRAQGPAVTVPINMQLNTDTTMLPRYAQQDFLDAQKRQVLSVLRNEGRREVEDIADSVFRKRRR